MIAMGLLLEAVLQLRAAILLEGAMPDRRDQALRADDGVGVIGAVQEIIAEGFADVGDPDDVVLGGALRQHRHLRLDLLMPGLDAA